MKDMNVVWSSLWMPPVLRFLSSAQARNVIGFALRTWVASMLALYVAFALQLESPHWAWLTVWIVAQPTPGMLLSKSLYRAIGTIGGSILGIVLIAFFAQTPELFVLALALIVGGCTVASNVLTNFRAYATVLAAYTAGIVASDAINAPDQVFFIGMARASCILVGIAASILVTSVFAPHRAEAETRAKLLTVLKDAARRAVFSWQGDPEVRMRIGSKLITDLIALDTLIEFAAAESGVFRIQAGRARSLLANIFSLISARRSLDAHLARCGWPEHDALDIFHEAILSFLNEMPERLDRGEVDALLARIADLREQLTRLQPERDSALLEDVVSERLVIDRMEDLLAHLNGALEDWRDLLQESRDSRPALSLNFHRDLRAAWINGLRAFLSVGVTGAFWIAVAWDHGPGALVIVSVLMSIFSSQPHPDRVGWTFFKMSIVATIMALICKFYVLPMGTGFEFLVLAFAIFLIPLGLFMGYPPTNLPAVSFSFVFLSLVQPSNPTVYDLADTLNSAIATQVGVLFGTLAYILIFPPDPAAARRYVTYRIRRGLEMIARLNPITPSCRWETRMYDRVLRLHDPQNLSGSPTDEWLNAGLGALTLGNEILRLRHWLATEQLSAELRVAVQKTIAAFGEFLPRPRFAAAEVKDQMERVAGLDPGPGQEQRRSWARILGALAEMDVYLAQHPRLLRTD